MNFADTARVIAFLAPPQRVPYSEIIQEVPGIDPTRTFPDLAKVDGIVVLTSEPAGLSLNDQLRSELKQFKEEA